VRWSLPYGLEQNSPYRVEKSSVYGAEKSSAENRWIPFVALP
jgi:hypothetical protein